MRGRAQCKRNAALEAPLRLQHHRCRCSTTSAARGKSHVAGRRAANAPRIAASATCDAAGCSCKAALRGPTAAAPHSPGSPASATPRGLALHCCAATHMPGCSTAPGCISVATSHIKCACMPQLKKPTKQRREVAKTIVTAKLGGKNWGGGVCMCAQTGPEEGSRTAKVCPSHPILSPGQPGKRLVR